MLKTISILVLALAGTAANAVTYTVNQMIGLGTVTGTIQTNGAVGVLGKSDITAFDLVVSALGASVELTQANSVIVTNGSAFTATAGNLFFDYSAASGALLFQFGSFGTGMKYYCNSSIDGSCYQGASAVPEAFNGPTAQFEARTGNQAFASVDAGTVPEPASWVLMIGGFGLVGAGMRRRSYGFGASLV